MLSSLARQHLKVVLTGEGADELLLGYQQFKHHRLLEAAHHDGGPVTRRRLRDYLRQHQGRPHILTVRRYDQAERLEGLFGNRPYPALRFQHFGKSIRFLQSRAAVRATSAQDPMVAVAGCLDPDLMRRLSPLGATQYMLFKTDLPVFLLSYLGDREEMANSIEGRVPFLDHELVALGLRLPQSLKLRGDVEKYALRQAVAPRLPPVMHGVKKQMFLAPTLDTLKFFGRGAFSELLSRQRLEEAGVFSPAAVGLIKLAARTARRGSVRYRHCEGALSYVLSIQILHDVFVKNFARARARFDRPGLDYSLTQALARARVNPVALPLAS
jgi:asparagine synthase (glutamine-hydrolysing)